MSEEERAGRRALLRRLGRVVRALGYLALAAMAVSVLVLMLRALPGLWGVAHGEGRPGVFIAQERECHRHCTWTGTFRPADGGPDETGVIFFEDTPPDRPGDEISVVMPEGVRGEVYRPGDRGTLAAAIMLIPAAVAGIAVLAYRFRERRVPGRHEAP